MKIEFIKDKKCPKKLFGAPLRRKEIIINESLLILSL